MKIATLYRKDGKVILETDNDALAQAATDSPQDVVVEQDVPPQGIAALRQIATELRTRHGAGCSGPSPTLVAFADRIDAAIRGLDCGRNDRPALCDLCQVREEVCSDAEGVPFCQECWDGWQATAVQP